MIRATCSTCNLLHNFRGYFHSLLLFGWDLFLLNLSFGCNEFLLSNLECRLFVLHRCFNWSLLQGCNYSFFFLHFTFNLYNLLVLNWAIFLQCSFLFCGSGNILILRLGCNEFLLGNHGCRLLFNGSLLLDRCYFNWSLLLHECNYSFFNWSSVLCRCLFSGSGSLNFGLSCNEFLLRNLGRHLLFNGSLLDDQCFFNRFMFNLHNLVLLNRAHFLHYSFFKGLLNWCCEFLGFQCRRFYCGNGSLLNLSLRNNKFLPCNLGGRLIFNGSFLHDRCFFNRSILLHGWNYSFFNQSSLLQGCLFCRSSSYFNTSLQCNEFLLHNLGTCSLFNGSFLHYQCIVNKCIRLHRCNDDLLFLHFTFNLCNFDILNWAFFLHCSFFKCLLNWCHECLGLQCWRFHFLNGWLFNERRSLLNHNHGCNKFLLNNRGCRLLFNGSLLLHRCYFKQCILLHG